MGKIVCFICLVIWSPWAFGEGEQIFDEMLPPPVGGAAVELAIIRAPELDVAKLMMFGDSTEGARRAVIQGWLKDGTASLVRRARSEGNYSYQGAIRSRVVEGRDELNLEYGLLRENVLGPWGTESTTFVGLHMSAEYQFLDDGEMQVDFGVNYDARERIKIDLATSEVPTSFGPSRLPVYSSFKQTFDGRIKLDGGNPVFAGVAQMRFVETEEEVGMVHLFFIRGASGVRIESDFQPSALSVMVHTTAFVVPEELLIEALLARTSLGDEAQILQRCFELVAEGKAELTALSSSSNSDSIVCVGQQFPQPRSGVKLIADGGRQLLSTVDASSKDVGTNVQSAARAYFLDRRQIDLRHSVDLNLAAPRIESYEQREAGFKNVAWYPVFKTAYIASGSVIVDIDQPTMLGALRVPSLATGGKPNLLIAFARADVPKGLVVDDVELGKYPSGKNWREPEAFQITTYAVKSADVLHDLATHRPTSDAALHRKISRLALEGKARLIAFSELRGDSSAVIKDESAHEDELLACELWESKEVPLNLDLFNRGRWKRSFLGLGSRWGAPSHFERDSDGRVSGDRGHIVRSWLEGVSFVGATKPSRDNDIVHLTFAQSLRPRDSKREIYEWEDEVSYGAFLFSVPTEIAARALLSESPEDEDLFNELLAATEDDESEVRLLAMSASGAGSSKSVVASGSRVVRGDRELMDGMESTWNGAYVEAVRAGQAEQGAFDEARRVPIIGDPFDFDAPEAEVEEQPVDDKTESTWDTKEHLGVESFDFPEPIGDFTFGYGSSTFVSASRPASGAVENPELVQIVDEFSYSTWAGSGEARLVGVVQAEADSSAMPKARAQARMLFVRNATDREAAQEPDKKTRLEFTAFVFSLGEAVAAEVATLDDGAARFAHLVASGVEPVAFASARNTDAYVGSYDLADDTKVGIHFEISQQDWERFADGYLGFTYRFWNDGIRSDKDGEATDREAHGTLNVKLGKPYLVRSSKNGENTNIVFFRVREIP